MIYPMVEMIRHIKRAMLGVCALGLFGVTPALAEPGDHVQLGKSTELAPRLEFGFLSRTNITQSPSDPLPGISLTVAPGGRLTHQTPDTQITLDGSYRLVKYFTRRLSSLDRFNDFNIQFDSAFLRTRPVGFVASNRAALVNNNATDRLGNTPFHTRTRNHATAGLQIRPGPILQLDLRGEHEFDDIRVPFGAIDSDTRGLNQRNGFGGRWNAEYLFFPRTAFVVDGNFTRYDWRENVVQRGSTGRIVALPDSTHFRVFTGIRGRFTDRLVAVGQVGYGSANYSVDSVQQACGGAPECTPGAGNAFDAKLSGLERLLLVGQLSFEFSPERRLALNYRKDFDDIFFTNYMAYHLVSLTGDSMLGDRFQVDGSAAVRQESYRGVIERNDVFLNMRGNAHYFFQDWIKLTAGIGYIQRNVPTAPNITFNDVQGRLLMVVTY